MINPRQTVGGLLDKAQGLLKPRADSDSGHRQPLPHNARGSILAGLAIIGVTFFGFGAWAALAPLASAVAAPATIVAEGRKRTVQHFEGGIISEVLVREGNVVRQGDILFRLDPVQAAARAERLSSQLHATRAYTLRLIAERDGLDEIVFPESLMSVSPDKALIQAIIRGERQLFEERRRSLRGNIELLEQKEIQLKSEIVGLDAQERSKTQQIEITIRELQDLAPLVEKGLVARPRFLALERDVAKLEGEIGEIVARRARANEGIAEARLQALQLEQQHREEIVSELRSAENQMFDLEQQLIAAEDVMSRLTIFSPETGTAQNVNITTVGAVIQPAQPLLEIAPRNAELIIEARVSPADVHDLQIGQQAEVRFVTLDTRRLPAIFGVVRTVSGDKLFDQKDGFEYFLAQVEVPLEEMSKLEGQRVTTGMPAEIVIQTGERTFLNYLVKPLADAMSRGLNER